MCFSAAGEVLKLLMMPSSSNSSAGGAEDTKQCIVNDQMEPFIVLYILVFIISLPGNLLSMWAFIRSPRAKVGLLLTETGCWLKSDRVKRDHMRLKTIKFGVRRGGFRRDDLKYKMRLSDKRR